MKESKEKNLFGGTGIMQKDLNGEQGKDSQIPVNGNGVHLHKKPVPGFNKEHFEDGGLLVDDAPEEQEKQTACILADFEKFRVTKEKEVPPTTPIAFAGAAPILAPGNITPVTAEGKAGKTAATSVFIAGSISQIGNAELFNDLTIEPNTEGRAVIHLDTEQSESDQQYNLNKVLERAGMKKTPEHYLSYNIRTLPLKEYQAFTNGVCQAAHDQFNGIYLIVVDGAADYITSVNDEAEANAIISFFISLSVQYNCPVLLVIHLNENAGKNSDTMPRGHIGRQAIRKGYCQLNITKDGDISSLQVLRARKAGSDTPLICFKYDKEKGYHVSVDADSITQAKQTEKEQAKRKNAQRIAEKLFAPPKALRYTDAISQIMADTSKSKPTAKRLLEDMEGWQIINKAEDGFYRLSS